jgi:hypothetical protein
VGVRHKVGQPMRADHTRMVEIANAGAKESAVDTGAQAGGYDMPPEQFAPPLMDKLAAQVKPLPTTITVIRAPS